MREYLFNTVLRALWSGTLLIGVPIIVAWLLQKIGDRIRTIGCFKCALGYRCGQAYWYFVAIGVACHETGHAVGAWITGNRVLEFVPFAPFFPCKKDGPPNAIGWVRHTIGSGLWGKVSQAIISTGPIWFGGLLILLLTRFLVGQQMGISYYDYFTGGEIPGLFSYLVACLRCAILLCCDLAGGVLFSGWKMLLWAYLVFCIASEIGMSDTDIKLARAGFTLTLGIVLALLFMPFVGKWIAVGVAFLLPKFFIVHVLMILAVFINMGFFVLERFIARIT